MGKTIVFAGMLLTFTSQGAVQIKRETCTQEFKQFHYRTLTLDEKAIGEAFNKMVQASGTSVPTNCIVEYPSDNGKPVWGMRRVVMDMQWYAIQVVHGLEKRVFRQHAIEILYNKRPGDVGEIREVVGVTVCRTPEVCRQKGLPFESGTKPKPVGPNDPPTETF